MTNSNLPILRLADLDLNRLYSYADYIMWRFEERVELLRGYIAQMGAPNTAHQQIVNAINVPLYIFLRNKPCKVFISPFDVRIPTSNGSKNDRDTFTVVQPDLCVICRSDGYDQRGGIGAPDLIVEVLSPSNHEKEMRRKYAIYEEAGVKEYWIVSPQEKTILQYRLANGKYATGRPLIPGDIATTTLLPGFELNIEEVFQGIEPQ
ncbi:MAG: Uma2 family endonuclease [Chitinophagia bacterium]|nr:Uma2 family endonuclease [Chitinophagia bacterium]